MTSIWLLIIILGGSGGVDYGGTRLETVEFANRPMCEDALKQVMTMPSSFRLGAVCVQSR